MPSQTKSIPEGYHTVTPHLIVQGAPKLLDFLKQAFDAKEKYSLTGPDGAIMHAEVKIGDSMVMIGEAMGEWKAMPASIALYTDNADALYALPPGMHTIPRTQIADIWFSFDIVTERAECPCGLCLTQHRKFSHGTSFPNKRAFFWMPPHDVRCAGVARLDGYPRIVKIV